MLRLVVARYSNTEIAARLIVSKRTVESHMAALFRKFAVTDRAALIRIAAPLLAPTRLTTDRVRISEQHVWLASVRARAGAMRTTAAKQRTEAVRQAATAHKVLASVATRSTDQQQ